MALAEGLVEVRPLGLTPVKGLEQPIDVFELVGLLHVEGTHPATTARVGDAAVELAGGLERLGHDG